LEYRYKAWKAGTKEKIIEMTLNSSGVRDIGRVFHRWSPGRYGKTVMPNK
jgi:hypothetical protein